MPLPTKSVNHLVRIIVLAVLVLSLFIIPHNWLFQTAPNCIHYKLSGIQCPFCGITRAAYLFSRFHFVAGLHYNPAVFLLPFYFVSDVTAFFYQRKWIITLKRVLTAAIVVSFLLVYAYRIVVYFR